MILPISFKDNMELMALVSKTEKNGENETAFLEDYSKGYPRRAWVCRREEVEYQINGIEAIAETSIENFEKFVIQNSLRRTLLRFPSEIAIMQSSLLKI